MHRSFIISLIYFSAIHLLFAQNYVSSYAGAAGGYVDGDTSVAKFREPFGICIDADDNLFIADANNHCIRKITAGGIVSTIAGTGSPGFADGPGATAQFNAP